MRIFRRTPAPPPPRPFFFLHLQKTGGSTVFRALQQALPRHRVSPAFYSLRQLKEAHPDASLPLPYDLLVGHLPLSCRQRLGGQAFAFSFLREPRQRLLSAYSHMRRAPGHGQHERLMELGGRLEDLLRPSLFRERIATPYLQLLSGHGRLRPNDRGEDLLPAALDGLRSLDFVGFTEALDDDLQRLLPMIGAAPIQGAVKRRNVDPDRHAERLESLPDDVRGALDEATGLDRQIYAEARRLAAAGYWGSSVQAAGERFRST